MFQARSWSFMHLNYTGVFLPFFANLISVKRTRCVTANEETKNCTLKFYLPSPESFLSTTAKFLALNRNYSTSISRDLLPQTTKKPSLAKTLYVQPNMSHNHRQPPHMRNEARQPTMHCDAKMPSRWNDLGAAENWDGRRGGVRRSVLGGYTLLDASFGLIDFLWLQ